MSIYHWLEIWTKQFSDLRWDSNSWQWHLWVQRVWYFCILIFSPPGPVLLVWEWYQKIKLSVKSHSTCPSLTVCGNSWSSSKVTFDCICFLGWWLHYLDQIGRNGPESWFCLIDHISKKTAVQLCKFRIITDRKESLPFTVFLSQSFLQNYHLDSQASIFNYQIFQLCIYCDICNQILLLLPGNLMYIIFVKYFPPLMKYMFSAKMTNQRQ